MASNGITTSYDDLGYPATATRTTPLTLTSTLTGLVIKGGPGRLVRLVVNTVLVGSGGVLTFYDNASAASGTVLYTLPVASTAFNVIGTVITLDLPATAGIYVANPSGTITAGAVTVAYS